jgi:hypothetical protein
MKKLELVNHALELVGLGRISALTSPDTNAKFVSGAYPLAVQTILRADVWPCVLKMASLVEDTTTGNASRYAHLYTLPTAVLRVVAVNGRSSGYLVISNSDIACDDESAKLLYLYDVSADDEPPFPGDLCQAVAYELAALISEARDPKRASLLRAEASRALLSARMAGGLDRPEQYREPRPWIQDNESRPWMGA